MSSNPSNVDLMVGNRPLSSLRVVDLKQELEKRGLSKSGSKKDLADRLRLHLTIENHRDTGASADEEELPNYSVHNQLADENPFIREYLASQAELFHSQKVVKKLVEEEAKRESETSADEDSPVKQPPPPVVEKEESPTVEPRRNSRRRTDSQKEEMTIEKVVTTRTRSSRSKSPAAATEAEVKSDKTTTAVPNEQLDKQPETKTVTHVPASPEKKLEDKTLPVSTENEKIHQPDKQEETPAEPIPPPQIKADEPPVEKINVEETQKEEPEPMEIETTATKENEIVEKDVAALEKPSSPIPEVEKSPAAAPEAKEEPEQNIKDKEENILPSNETADNSAQNGETESRSTEKSEGAAIMEVRIDKEEIKMKEKEAEAEDASDESSSVDDDKSSRSRDRSRSKSRSRSRSVSKSRSRSRSASKSRSRSRSVESQGSNAEKKSEVDEEDSRDKTPISTPKPTDEARQSRSASRSPIKEKEKSPIKEAKKDENVTEDIEMKSEEPKSEKSESSPKQAPKEYSKFDLAGEEALDYGEDDDEEKNENDSSDMSWIRRNLSFKNKSTIEPPSTKWALEIESKHLVVKSELLNKFYEDIKLVPLEQLKLEEKTAENSASKIDLSRKSSMSHEEQRETEPEPMITRTVENIQPVIKRTISIIPATKVKDEELEKNLTPPRNPQTNILLITNLVRPFTLSQLKDMLQRTGNLQDIWVDKIKSKCIAKFETQEEAFETRAALHGVRWPSSNPKSLFVDYSTQDNLDEHKAKENPEQIPVSEKPVTAQYVPVREWDMGKKAEPKSPRRNRKRSRSRSKSRDRETTKRSRRTPSPGRRRHSRSPGHHERRRSGGREGKEPEPMGKALDELFKKTTAAPSIYWLPLTPNQIAEKEELRRKRMLERDRRLAELNKMRPR